MNDNHREPQTSFSWRKDADGYVLSSDRKRIMRLGGAMVPVKIESHLHREFTGLLPSPFRTTTPGRRLTARELAELNKRAPSSRADKAVELERETVVIEHDFNMPGPIRFDVGLRRYGAVPENAAEIFLTFTNKYGFLGSDRTADDAQEEYVDRLLKVQTELQYFMDSGGKYLEYGEIVGPTLRMCVEADKNGRSTVRYRPESLYAWLWLRVADDLSSGVKWDGLPCLYCHEPIGRGPGGHRPQAKFCGDNHKKAFSRLSATEQKERKAKARELQRNRREGGT